jgi:processing peptidase subunit beta
MLLRSLRRTLPRRHKSTAAASIVGALPEYTEVTTLPNGLRVATERVPAECETVTLGVWIDAGSRYEAASNNGAAHFLEHIAFKGTTRRTQRQLEVAIEDMGAHLNAYTSREQTVYYAKLFRKDVDVGMEILGDILQNSLLDSGAVDRERDVILREMEEVNKQHEELILDLLHEAAYVNGGLGRTILGPEENIRTLKSQDLRSYIDTHYTAPRMVVAAAGALDHAEVVELAAEHWSARPTSSQTDFPVDFDRAVFTPTEVRQQDLSEPRAHVAIAFAGAEWTSPYSVPLMVLQTLVGQWDRLNPAAGGGDSAPAALARHLAASDSCHSYMTFNTCYKDAGLFGLYLVAPPEGVDQAVATTMKYFATLASTPDQVMSPSDVERAKAQLKANLISQLDALAHVCEELGRQLLTYDRRIPLAELLARIDTVSYEDVTATAAVCLKDKGHAQAAHGSLGSLRPFADCHVSNFS